MPVTPNFGFVYPDGSGVPSRKSWVEDPLKSVDSKMQAVLAAMGLAGRKIQDGVVNVSGTSVAAGAGVSRGVSFPVAFGATPRVYVSMAGGPGGSNYLVARTAGPISAAGFNVYVYNTSTGSQTWSNLAVNWFAIGPA